MRINCDLAHSSTRLYRSLSSDRTPYVRWPTRASTNFTDRSSFRIITLTANDLLLNMYKKFTSSQ